MHGQIPGVDALVYVRIGLVTTIENGLHPTQDGVHAVAARFTQGPDRPPNVANLNRTVCPDGEVQETSSIHVFAHVSALVSNS